MNNQIYEMVRNFKKRHPLSISWRIKAHCKMASKLICDDEKIIYAFPAQKNADLTNFINTYVVILTERRMILVQKRLIYGFNHFSITPAMFNDLDIRMGLIWGKVLVEMLKETVILSNLSKDALLEIQKVMAPYMIEQKRKYSTEQE